MSWVKTATFILIAATMASAQESGIHVRTIRVLATDPEALARFYEKAFGMSETRRPVTTATFQEIVVNSGSTVELAKKAATTPIVITTRPQDAPAGAMASLILQVPDIDKAIESVKRSGGTVLRPARKSSTGYTSSGLVLSPILSISTPDFFKIVSKRFDIGVSFVYAR